jgi:serine protease Do
MRRFASGFIVAGLLDGEPTTLADLQPEDVITAINGRPISDANHLWQDKPA